MFILKNGNSIVENGKRKIFSLAMSSVQVPELSMLESGSARQIKLFKKNVFLSYKAIKENKHLREETKSEVRSYLSGIGCSFRSLKSNFNPSNYNDNAILTIKIWMCILILYLRREIEKPLGDEFKYFVFEPILGFAGIQYGGYDCPMSDGTTRRMLEDIGQTIKVSKQQMKEIISQQLKPDRINGVRFILSNIDINVEDVKYYEKIISDLKPVERVNYRLFLKKYRIRNAIELMRRSKTQKKDN
jgi:hypothetical protein